MALVDLIMPKLGEGIMEATILNWLKKEGDTINEEDPLVEIATDKIDSEVPATASGIIKEILYKENEIVKIGAVLATIETGDPETEPNHTSSKEVQEKEKISENENPKNKELEQYADALHAEIPLTDNNTFPSQPNDGEGANNGFYSPLVMNIAKEEKVPFAELEKIQGTGKEQRLTKNDLLRYLENRKSANEKSSPEKVIAKPLVTEKGEMPPSLPPEFGDENTEIVEMDRMRKMIAHHMKESQNVSATVTSFAEADVTNMVNWRNRVKRDFEKAEHTRITFTPMFIECVARVLRKYPWVNSSVSGDKVILKKDINIGMATALPNGNLIVPVIKNADTLNLVGLAKQVNELGDKARRNKLHPADTQQGTFSLTNVGTFGSITGTPIINQPQVAILAVGAIKKKPVVLETKDGDVIAIRHMMWLALSYDHRIIDGGMGSLFLADVQKEIESWDVNRNR